MVNTFLPYPDFVKVAKLLDYRRLGKQRVEAKQIINILTYLDSCLFLDIPDPYPNVVLVNSKGYKIVFFKGQSPFTERANILKNRMIPWINHPVTQMWFGYTECLKHYYNIIVQEWVDRGYNNTMLLYQINHNYTTPWWVNWGMLNLSHQASLVRKDQDYYSKYFTDIPDIYSKFSYIWPSALSTEQITFLKKYPNCYSLSELADKIA